MKSTNPTITVIIADDHQIVRDGFGVMLKKVKDIKIIGEAKNGEELISIAKMIKPDVIMVDVKMPVIDGIDATRQIKSLLPETGIIALSMFSEEELIMDMLNAGASGYLIKNADKDEIVAAIKAVHKKNQYFCDEISAILGSRFKKNSTAIKKNTEPVLTKKDIEIIKLICQQYSNKQIADCLFLDKRTIEWHRNQILNKLDVINTAGIVLYAAKNDIC